MKSLKNCTENKFGTDSRTERSGSAETGMAAARRGLSGRVAALGRFVFRLLPWILIAGMVVTGIVIVRLPALLTHIVRSRLDALGMNSTGINVAEITHHRIILADGFTGRPEDGITITRIEAEYTIGGLRNGHLNRLAVTGFRGQVKRRGHGSWELAGLEPLLARLPDGSTPGKDLLIDRLELTDAGVEVQGAEKSIEVRLNGILTSVRKAASGSVSGEGKLSVSVLDTLLSIGGNAAWPEGSGRITFEAKAADLETWLGTLAAYGLRLPTEAGPIRGSIGLSAAINLTGPRSGNGTAEVKSVLLDAAFSVPAGGSRNGSGSDGSLAARTCLENVSLSAVANLDNAGTLSVDYEGGWERLETALAGGKEETRIVVHRTDLSGKTGLAGREKPSTDLRIRVQKGSATREDLSLDFEEADIGITASATGRPEIEAAVRTFQTIAHDARLHGPSLVFSLHDRNLNITVESATLSYGKVLSAPLTLRGTVRLNDSRPQIDMNAELGSLSLPAEYQLEVPALHITGNPDRFHIEVPTLQSPRFTGLAVRDLRIDADRTDSVPAFEVSAHAECLPDAVRAFLPPEWSIREIPRDIGIKGRLSDPARSRDFSCRIEVPDQAVVLHSPQADLSAEMTAAMTVEGNADRLTGRVEITSGEMQIATSIGDFSLKKVNLTAETGNCPVSVFAGSDAESLAGISVEGLLSAEGDSTFKDPGIGIGNFSCAVPWHWDHVSGFSVSRSPDDSPGSLTVASLRYHSLEMSPVTLSVSGGKDGITLIQGKLHTPDGSIHADLTVEGSLEPGPRAGVSFSVEVPDLSRATGLRNLIKETGNTDIEKLEGGLTLSGDVRIDPAQEHWQGTGRITLRDLSLALDTPRAVVNGINADLRFPDIRQGVSEPHQTLTFSDALIGTMAIGAGRVALMVENRETLFIEKGELGWCGGTLTAHALKVNPFKPDLDFVLYADNIQLGQLFALQTTLQGDAEGTLYGRLPFSFREGKVRYAGGFLYAVPGLKGCLRITNPEILTANIPANDPRRAQLNAALRNLELDLLRIDISGPTDLTRLAIRVEGRSADDPKLPPVKLNTNIEADINDVIDLGRTFERLNLLP